MAASNQKYGRALSTSDQHERRRLHSIARYPYLLIFCPDNALTIPAVTRHETGTRHNTIYQASYTHLMLVNCLSNRGTFGIVRDFVYSEGYSLVYIRAGSCEDKPEDSV